LFTPLSRLDGGWCILVLKLDMALRSRLNPNAIIFGECYRLVTEGGDASILVGLDGVDANVGVALEQ
jgi:hypothetical protein